MSFSYSGGVITQTGTDANPLGMSGLTGVTITGTSEYRVIQLDGVKLIINGTLSMPKYYRLYFINTSTVDFKINGTVNVDYFTTTADGTVYHTTPWVEFGRQTTSSSGAECMSVYGTLNWRGGSILADPVIYFRSGATVLFNNSIIDSTNGNMFRIFTSNLTFEGPLTNIGKRTTINTSGITLDNYSPKGGGGLDHGGVNTDFTLNNFSPEANVRDSALRFNNSDSIFNASTGMYLKVLPFDATGTHPHNGGGCRLYRKVSTNIKDISNNPLQNVKTFLPSYDDSNRVNLTSNFGSGWDFTAVSNTILTTAANGKSPTHNQILKVWYLVTTNGNDLEVIKFDKYADDSGIFSVISYKYSYLIQSNDYNLNGLGDLELAISLLPDANITEANKATVNAYPVTVSIVSNTITITGNSATVQNLTSAQYYDLLAAYLEDNFGTHTELFVTRSGSEIDATDYNVNLSYINYTGDIVTDQVITLSNGASFVGTFTDTNGTTTVTELTLTGLKANTEVRIYEAGTTTEIDGVENSGTTFATTTSASSVDIVVHALGYEYQKLNAVDTSQNLTLPISQRADRNYSNP